MWTTRNVKFKRLIKNNFHKKHPNSILKMPGNKNGITIESITTFLMANI